jgi:hypothetical protein
MTTSPDRYLARLDGIHGAPPDDPAELPQGRRPCDVCGGPAPTSPGDSSHDDCGMAHSPHGGTVPVVAKVPKSAVFQFGYDGHDFYLLEIGAVVAVAR